MKAKGWTPAHSRLAAAFSEFYRTLDALWREIAEYDMGHEGSRLLEVLNDSRAVLERYRREKAKVALPPVADKTKKGGHNA